MGRPQRVNIQSNGYAWEGGFYTGYKIDPSEALSIIKKTGARWVSLTLPDFDLDTKSLSAQDARRLLENKIDELS